MFRSGQMLKTKAKSGVLGQQKCPENPEGPGQEHANQRLASSASMAEVVSYCEAAYSTYFAEGEAPTTIN